MSEDFVDFEAFKKERLERMRNEKWHKKEFYFDEKALLEEIEKNEYKVGMCQKTFGEIKKLLETKHSFLEFSKCDENLIVLGRRNDRADRDYKFFLNTKEALSNMDFKNCFFVNYTGHCGSVGAALALEGIPLVWNLKLGEDAWAETRIVEQFQDYYQELETKPNEGLQSFGLMLECPHGHFETFDVEKFPSAQLLKECGIEKICLLVEEPFDKAVEFEGYDFYHQKFKDYFENLKEKFEVFAVGIDENEKQANICVSKQKIKNVNVYYSNFKCKKEK